MIFLQGLSEFFFDDAKMFYKLGYVLMHGFPNHFGVDFEIIVDQNISHSYDVPPLDIRMLCLKLLWQLGGCFPHHLNTVEYCELAFFIFQERHQRIPGNKSLSLSPIFLDIPQ